MFRPGDLVVYRMPKHTTRPGIRARNIHAAPRGEFYDYEVDKFWVVAEVLDDQRLLLRTRRGKQHTIFKDDPNLRHSRWWERLLYRRRFPNAADQQPGNACLS